MNIILAIATGSIVGYILERGDFCFHSTWRDLLARPRNADLFRAYLLMLIVSIPLVQGLSLLGLIEPWIPPFAWQANVIGGLTFGVGMVIAASCISGVFYKLGHGMLGMLIAMLAWAVGDIATYLGPLAPLREALTDSPLLIDGRNPTLLDTGILGYVVLGFFALAMIAFLWRSPVKSRSPQWNWRRLGLATGVFLSLAWLLARAGGSDYTFGTSGVPSGLLMALTGAEEGGSFWIPLTLLAIAPGAFIAARRSGTLWVRGESRLRYIQLAIGGLIMGVGAALAGGCNLGHGMVGVPLLSLGSIASTLSIIMGVVLADGFLKVWRRRQDRPAEVAV